MRNLIKNVYKLIPGKKYVYDLLKQVYLPPRSVYRFLVHYSPFTIDVEGKPLLIQHNGFHFYIENEFYWRGYDDSRFERISRKYWLKLVRKAEIVVDVGANTGLYSLFASLHNPDLQIYAFEPIQRNVQKLLHNAAINQFTNIEVIPKAASDVSGTAVIYAPDTDVSTTSTLNPAVAAERSLAADRIEIETIRLDEFIEEKKLRKIDLIKIDVEGFEVPVIKGLGRYLAEFKPTILVEVRMEENGRLMNELIEGLDYLVFDIDEQNDPRPVPSVTRSSSNNFLICKPAIAQEIGLI